MSDDSLEVLLAANPQVARDFQGVALAVTITNRSSAPIRLRTVDLDVASLVFELRDGSGNRIPLMPPPVPLEDDGQSGRQVLEPAESIAITYHGGELVGFTPEPGRYMLRFRYRAEASGAGDWQGLLQSAEVAVTLTP